MEWGHSLHLCVMMCYTQSSPTKIPVTVAKNGCETMELVQIIYKTWPPKCTVVALLQKFPNSGKWYIVEGKLK